MIIVKFEPDELQSLLMSIAVMSTKANNGSVTKPFVRFIDLFEGMCDRHGDMKVHVMMAEKTTTALEKLIDAFDAECEKQGLFD